MEINIFNKTKMLPEQYFVAKDRLIELAWISRGSATNLIGSNMFWVTEEGAWAYRLALEAIDETAPKWGCPKKIIDGEIPQTKKERINKFIMQNLEWHHDSKHINGHIERMFIVLGDVFKGKVKMLRSDF